MFADDRVYLWGEEYEPTRERIISNIEGFLVGELNNQDLWSVTGPKGEQYRIRIAVTLEPETK
jgi:hypothetical protein